MKLEFVNNVFVLRCKYEERILAKTAGFKWHPVRQFWFTDSPTVAARLREKVSEETSEDVMNRILVSGYSTPDSPWRGSVPNESLLYPHQIEAVKFALGKEKSYLGLDPGLGKTACAATIAQTLFEASGTFGAVYVTPPFLVRNIIAEFRKWAPRLYVDIYDSKPGGLYFGDILILPDTRLECVHLKPVVDRYRQKESSVIFIDEAHRFKTSSAKRTQALFGGRSIGGILDGFKKQVFMSGTPMPNRPIELYPVLSYAAPQAIDHATKMQFALKYCAAKETHHGWDMSGASNVQELALRVIYPTGQFMLRMKKDLIDLPPKLEQVFLLSERMSPQLTKLDTHLAKYSSVMDMMKAQLSDGEDLHLATYRKLLGVKKAHAILPFISALMEETRESMIIYAYHKDAVTFLKESLAQYEPYLIDGSTSEKSRHEQVEDFQKSSRRIFIGNYQAMGVGFTLTKATRIIFVEFDWVPGVNDQASDRAHRIGQAKSVLVQYVAYQGSVDESVINALLTKRVATKHI